MKTIQVSDEIYDFLINLSKEIKTQDNRCTAPPYFYQVQEDSEVCAPEGCGDEVWVLDGEVHLRTEDEIKEAIFEYNDWDLDDKNDQKAYNDLSKYDREDILEVNYRKYYVDIVHKYSNCFFTFKAYEEHLRKKWAQS